MMLRSGAARNHDFKGCKKINSSKFATTSTSYSATRELQGRAACTNMFRSLYNCRGEPPAPPPQDHPSANGELSLRVAAVGVAKADGAVRPPHTLELLPVFSRQAADRAATANDSDGAIDRRPVKVGLVILWGNARSRWRHARGHHGRNARVEPRASLPRPSRSNM